MIKNYTLILVVSIITTTLFAQNPNGRVTLVETFTSSTCGPCNPGNTALESLLGNATNDDKFTSLKYQMSWPGTGDPYFTDEANSRRTFYGVTSIPNSFVDEGYDGNPSNMGQGHLNSAYGVDPEVLIDAYYQVNAATQTVDVQVDIEALVDHGPGHRLMVAIFEYTTTNNVKSNGENTFYHVMKKMVPGSSGTVLSPHLTGETIHKDLTYTFQGNYVLPQDANSPIDHASEHSIEDFNDLGVVVWVQQLSLGGISQSAYAQMGNANLTESEDILSAKLYPNPSSSNTTVAFHVGLPGEVTIEVHNILGQQIHSELVKVNEAGRTTHLLNTEDYSSGLYNVSISTLNGSISKRLLID